MGESLETMPRMGAVRRFDAELSIVWRAWKYLDDFVEEVTMEGVRIWNEHAGEIWLSFDRLRPEQKSPWSEIDGRDGG